MADAFFEARKLFAIHLEGINEHIEVAALITHVGAETNSVIDDDYREADGERKDPGVHSFVVANSRDDGNHESSVARGHVAIGKDIFPVPIMLDAMDDELNELGEAERDDRNNKDGVGLDKSHKFI